MGSGRFAPLAIGSAAESIGFGGHERFCEGTDHLAKQIDIRRLQLLA
jgi:hypothetical protein